jgi:betaine-aldehyde dehydrogenase
MSLTIPSFVDGRSVDCSGELFFKLDPSTGLVLAGMHKARQSDVDAAVRAAQRGFGCWSAMPVPARLRILGRAAALIRERAPELAKLEAQETGRPIEGVLASSVHAGADCLDGFANATSLLSDAWRPAGGPIRVIHAPLGVCVGLGSSHRPIHSVCAQVAPVLATGNTVVFKPSDLAPVSAFHLATIFSEAGFPPGVFNVMQGQRGTAGMVMGHRDAAAPIGGGAASNGPSGRSRELPLDGEPGNGASLNRSILIVFDDADVEAVCKAAVSALDSRGETGNSGARVFVQRSMVDRLVARLIRHVGRLHVGRPTVRSTDVGPLITGTHLASMLQFVASCVEGGAHVVAGGQRAAAPELADGFFIAPTVLANCTDDMMTAHATCTGPLLAVLPFDSECEVVRRANGGACLDGAAIFTSDTDRAIGVATALKTEAAWINTFDPSTRKSDQGQVQTDLACVLRYVRSTVIHTGAVEKVSVRHQFTPADQLAMANELFA